MNVKIESSWKDALATEWDAPYFEKLTGFVRNEYGTHTVYPPAAKIFAAFDTTPLTR